ncbi:hypothetical protein TCAL_07957 [Tigriopus californicus]|uniref:Retinol dehydrogenase 13 n=1 Tax=Tigriopus californicus TaxID=6832 RepID=A0A553NB65_TIGCA|nr:retinol dehydrogenase 13-like [Tigriopus californicus]TRY62657.1 hypothetical protein TCAL_07957 [Tigriopus californicus]|eukprot:TCALIF_07957-PA protein Name:"Similar to RDH13 Retinol dehydrogenase 13 (Homo sapiens)" AED:0.25 eAED:0.25 QI:0/-1/0/1/-1/1/1/0/321
MNVQVAQNLATAGVGAVSVYFLREWFKGGVCTSQARMDGQTVVITGCNVGIGKETALDLSQRGAKVVMACRNLELAHKAADDIRQATQGNVVVYQCDLANLKSVRRFAQEVNEKEERIDVLINNAGVMMCPYSKTEDGFEMQIGTNHLGHFLLTNLLLDKIKASAPARIVHVSSRAHERGQMDLDDLQWEKKKYNSMNAYGQSKLANVLFSNELARRLHGTGVTSNSLHPGVVKTELGRHIEAAIGPLKYLLYFFVFFFMKNAKEGAQTSIHCAVEETLKEESGKYFSDCKEKEAQPLAKDEGLAKRLWELSSKLVNLNES